MVPFTTVAGKEINWKQRTPVHHGAMVNAGIYQVSIQNSPNHYCEDGTVEIAIFVGGSRIKDFDNFPDSNLIAELFGYDSVAGWVTQDQLADVIKELERISA